MYKWFAGKEEPQTFFFFSLRLIEYSFFLTSNIFFLPDWGVCVSIKLNLNIHSCIILQNLWLYIFIDSLSQDRWWQNVLSIYVFTYLCCRNIWLQDVLSYLVPADVWEKLELIGNKIGQYWQPADASINKQSK